VLRRVHGAANVRRIHVLAGSLYMPNDSDAIAPRSGGKRYEWLELSPSHDATHRAAKRLHPCAPAASAGAVDSAASAAATFRVAPHR
jgi:hypothetical protein